MMTTQSVYVVGSLDDGTPAVPDTPAVPPTYADVDAGGLTGNGDDFVWPDQGDGNPENDAVIPTNLYTTYNGEQVPALRYIDTYNGELLDYGDHPPIGALAFRDGWLDWHYIGYLAGSGVRGVGTTRYPNGDIGQAIRAAYSSWPFPSRIVKTVYQWEGIDCLFGTCRAASQYYPSGTTNSSSDGSPLANRALYSWTLWLPADADGNLIRNRVQTDPGSPFIPGEPAIPPRPVFQRAADLGDGNFFPGSIDGFLAGLLNVGKRAFDYITGASDDWTDTNALPDIPAYDYSSEIAKSILTNEPINVPQSEIPESDIEKLVDAIPPAAIGSEDIPVTDTPIPYSDDNFYEDENGNVKAHTPETKQKYPNNTSAVASGNTGIAGLDNPLGSAGQAQVQVVVPSNGSEPYMLYTDHAYHNLNSTDPGEVPDPIKQALSTAVHGVKGYGKIKKFSPLDSPYHQTTGVEIDTTTPNTGKMRNYPPNIRGDVRKQIRIPLTKLTPEQQRRIKRELQYQDYVRSGKIKVKGGMPVKEQVLHEGWESPKHTDIDKDEKKRWFNPADIAPEYPKEPPASAPREPDRDPIIKITKKDLLRNHRLKDSEIEEMMNTINKINAFLSAHPEELIHARKRYPKDDPRLAELNWKMDQQLSASSEYMEKHFPENEKLFNKLQKSIKRNIELTDPKNFKNTSNPLKYTDVFEDPVKRKSPARFFKKPKKKQRPAFLRKKKK